jgi:hypothetical protein
MSDEVLNEAFDVSQLDPENLPSDPEELLKLLNSKQEAAEEEADEETDEKPDEPESSTEPVQEEEEEAPILSADGKHQIPYTVLKQEREARRAAAEQAAMLQAELEALKAAQASGVAAQSIPETPIDPELAELESEFPEIAKLNAATRAEMQRLRQEMEVKDQRLQAMAAQWEREQQAKQQVEMEQVHAAIDANPTLRFLRSEDGDPKLWEAAVQIDVELQGRPAWAEKPVAERFAAVVRRLEEDFGPVSVPGKYQSVATKAAKPAKPKEDDEDILINTLSDLRGGSSPESSGVSAEKLSAAEIGDYFLKMDPAQLAKMDPAELLARL